MAKKRSEISVSEFKSWISGIQDMQEDDWTPNKSQWNKIRDKINLLSEQEDIAPAQQPQYQQPQYNQNYGYQQPNIPLWTPEQASPLEVPLTAVTYDNGQAAEFI
jgi:hypothetical protein